MTGLFYEFGPFRVDPVARVLSREGQTVSLTPKAFETLLVLIEKRGRLVEKDELMTALWPDTFVEEANLTNNIWLLRKALGEGLQGQNCILTVPKRGYRFIADVREVSEESEELVLERHSFARVITESDTEVGGIIDSIPAVSSQSTLHKLGLPFLALVILAGSALVFGGGFLWWKSGETHRPAKPEMAIERLTNGGNIHSATISQDGKYFVYVQQDGGMAHLWLRQTEESNAVEIITPVDQYIKATTFSPDGQYIYFVAAAAPEAPGNLFRVPTFGGPSTNLIRNVHSIVTVSPEGQQLAFVRSDGDAHESRLIVASVDGNRERVLLEKDGNEWLGGCGPSWSPDGAQIAVGVFTEPSFLGERTGSIVGVDVKSGATKSLTSQTWDNCGRIAWTDNGQGLVLIGTKQGESNTTGRDQVWYVSEPKGEVQRVPTDLNRYYYDSLGVSSDLNSLLVVPFSRVSQIWSMQGNGETRSAVQITSGTTDGRGGLAPMPDGRIAFIRRTGDHVDIWRMNQDGTEQRQLTSEPPFLEELHATPDGRYLVFASNRSGRSHLFRVDADGANLKQLTDGDGKEVDSDCSPDGKWVVYASDALLDGQYHTTLWKVGIDGGASLRLTDHDANTPRFSPDGKYVSYVYQDRDGKSMLGVISSNGGAPIKTFPTVQTPELSAGCHFTPDGKALAYIVDQKDVGNIWLQPLDEGPARALTNFQSGQLYYFAFSSDGLRLFLARGYDVHDATLIKNFRR